MFFTGDLMDENPRESLRYMGEPLIRWVGELSRSTRIVGSSIAVFVAYFALSFASYQFVIPPSSNAVFWPPTGMVFALFIRARWARRFWPGWVIAIFFGQLTSVRYHGGPLMVALAWSL